MRSESAARRRVPLRLTLAAALLASCVAARARVAAQAGLPPARPPVQLSDVVTHSALARCDAAGGVRRVGMSRIRVATWNIHAARSAPIEAVADVIEAIDPDVIALQELDIETKRSGYIDQPETLADELGLGYAFTASIKWDEGDYGLALLSRWPIVEVRRHRLDIPEAREPRIVMEAVLCVGGRPLRVFNHHADVRATSGETGLALLRELVQPALGAATVVMGDFNAEPDAPGVRGLIADGLTDLAAGSGAKTIDDRRVDYLLVGGGLAPAGANARVWTTDKSDHHAVYADIPW